MHEDTRVRVQWHNKRLRASCAPALPFNGHAGMSASCKRSSAGTHSRTHMHVAQPAALLNAAACMTVVCGLTPCATLRVHKHHWHWCAELATRHIEPHWAPLYDHLQVRPLRHCSYCCDTYLSVSTICNYTFVSVTSGVKNTSDNLHNRIRQNNLYQRSHE